MTNRSIAFLFFLFAILTESQAQVKVIPGWRKDIKNSLNSINKSNSLCIDKDGNSYVLGTTWFPDSAKNILLVKFGPNGEEIWSRIYDNPSHEDDIPMNMCVDNENNIWICGISKRSKENADFLVVKFTFDGVPVTEKLYDGNDHLFDCATTIISDKQGNIYAAGYETTLDSGINMILLKFKQDGNMLWKRSYATRQMDVAEQLALDDSSNIYVCGTSNNGPHSADLLLQKYDPDGKKKWQLIYDGALNQNDVGQFLELDDSMHVYVSGFMNHVNNRADIPVLKITRNGQIIQETGYNGHIADCGSAHLNAGKNFVYIIGECDDYNIGVNSTFLVGYDKTGNQKKYVKAPKDVRFTKSAGQDNRLFIFGTKTTHPESTLMPFISLCNADTLSWTYSDTTIYGLTFITFTEMHGDDIFFLGDDTGDATGTISIFKYTLAKEEKPDEVKEIKEPEKVPVKKKK